MIDQAAKRIHGIVKGGRIRVLRRKPIVDSDARTSDRLREPIGKWVLQ